MKTNKPQHGPGRHEQYRDSSHPGGDKPAARLAEPAICPRCRATYQEGRWLWKGAATGATPHTCPACKRIEENRPDGYVELEGPFLGAHREEVMNLVKGLAARAREDHPLQRLISLTEEGGGIQLTTTDQHLARAIAVAVHDAYKGELDLRPGSDGAPLRANWKR